MPYKNPEEKKAKDKEYRETHKAEIYQMQRQWFLNNKEHSLAAIADWRARHRERCRASERRYGENLKNVVLGHYGNGRVACVTCGEDRLPCLSIDHVNGGGIQHRKKINNSGGRAFYSWLKVNGFPSGYQTLCMNCQFIKKFSRKSEAGCPTRNKET